MERFNRTVYEEFSQRAWWKKLYASLDELQADLDEWLHYYNYERPHQGYRNMGRRPIETVNSFMTLSRKKAKRTCRLGLRLVKWCKISRAFP